MTAISRTWKLTITAGMALLLGACSGASSPAATSAPNGAATSAPNGAATATAQGVSDPATAGAAAGGGDACALLTKAEVEAAFGETMLEPVATVDHGSPSCAWSHKAGGLDLTVELDSRPSTADSIKQTEKLYGTTAVDVPGVGDAAFKFGGILEFVKGTKLVIVGTGDGPGIISDDNFNGLAKKIAGRV